MGQHRGALEDFQRAGSRHRRRDARAIGDVRIHAVPGAAGRVQPGDDKFLERMRAYALKAAREGKQETSWLNPHQAYEAGITTFIARILDRTISAEFLDSLETLARRVSLLGALNSLGQLTLEATMPGVPDFYQSTEFSDLSLVDPDNRRPVDFAGRRTVLSSVKTPDWEHLARHW